MKAPFFTLLKTSQGSKARRGRMQTAHGVVETPVFMPVGTQGTVKSVSPHQLEELGAQIILGNTYHLYLRPGCSLLRDCGGLHRFASWERPMLTDSGGFQVWSLKSMRKITPQGVLFRSHLDGSKHLFTPESVMEAQRAIGADIIMAFDECTPYPATFQEAEHSLEFTSHWTERAHAWLEQNPPLHGYPQHLFGIVQGGMHKALREKAAAHLTALDLPGYALGGLSVGEPESEMYAMAEHGCGVLPESKPRYVMGVGTPANLLRMIAVGVDMFDCVMPTRNARNGMVFTSAGAMHFKAAKFARELDRPLDEACGCYTCTHFSRAYLRHLYKAGEILALTLGTIHNLHFYCHLMAEARARIDAGEFEIWSTHLLERWNSARNEGQQ